MVERQRMRELYAECHKILYHVGFKYQLSFYGTLKEPYDGIHVQARIEVMSRDVYTKMVMKSLHDAFSHYVPDKEYTLFKFEDFKLSEVLPE